MCFDVRGGVRYSLGAKGVKNVKKRYWKDLSILLVGCGSAGRRHARALASLGVTDMRAWDADQRQIDSLFLDIPSVRPCSSLEKGLQDRPDAVFILTPPETHLPLALRALRAGSHVFCEKLLCETLKEAGRLKKELEKSGRAMAVGMCFRYHAGVRRARELLDQGTVGRLVSVRSLMGEHLPAVRPDYRTLFVSKSSGAFDLVHDVDLSVWFANLPVRRVFSVSGTFSDIGIEAPDTVEILIGFEGRCSASIHLDLFQRPRRRQLELIGTEGVLVLDFSSWNQWTLSFFRASSSGWDTETGATNRDDMFREEDMAFLTAIAEGSPVACTVEEACRSLSVIEQARKAGFRMRRR